MNTQGDPSANSLCCSLGHALEKMPPDDYGCSRCGLIIPKALLDRLGEIGKG